MIKYLGSKRTLVPGLGAIAEAVEARTAVDLFTGTTRVAQEFKRRGLVVTACDIATYSGVLADCYIRIDADDVDTSELTAALAHLNALPGRTGYVTETFCTQARFFQPHNGRRIDAIRVAIDADFGDSPLRPILLTSLLEAADRVDSTTGVHMAYLKTWAPRSFQSLHLRAPALLPGPGSAYVGDVFDTLPLLPSSDLVYIDPPYNQHRYFTNYHIWETLVRWDSPETYGVARKRADSREVATKSVFNRKREMPDALWRVLRQVDADVVVVSYNDESWVGVEEIVGCLQARGHETVTALEIDSKRYVGAQIGIHNSSGEKVGSVGRLRNLEYVVVAGLRAKVSAATAAFCGVRTARAVGGTAC